MSSGRKQELKKASFTQTAAPPVPYCQRAHTVPGPIPATWDTGGKDQDSEFSQVVLSQGPPCRRLIRLQGVGTGGE